MLQKIKKHCVFIVRLFTPLEWVLIPCFTLVALAFLRTSDLRKRESWRYENKERTLEWSIADLREALELCRTNKALTYEAGCWWGYYCGRAGMNLDEFEGSTHFYSDLQWTFVPSLSLTNGKSPNGAFTNWFQFAVTNLPPDHPIR